MVRWSLLAILAAAVPVGWLLAAANKETETQGANAPRSPVADARGIEFFEKKIRPVLVEQCYQCHSTEAQKGKKLKGAMQHKSSKKPMEPTNRADREYSKLTSK